MYDLPLKVLLIEDNPGDAHLIREILRETNATRYALEWVDSLSLGFEQLGKDTFDVVLLDLLLPDSHGVETLERTLSQSNDVPIVVLTGLDDEDMAIHALRQGAQDYFIKGDVNSRLLGRSIRYAIERKRAEVALKKAHDTLEEKVREQTNAFVKQNKKLLMEIEERRQAENLYQTLAEKSIAGVYIVQDGVFRYLNCNAAGYAGYTPEELVGKEAFCIVYPEDRKRVKLRAGQMLKGEREAPYEFRIKTKDGRKRWILETVTSIVHDGKPAILGNSMDVTELKKAEEEVRESHQLLSNIISFLPDATVIIDKNGKVLAWNRAMEEMTGVEAEDMVGLDNYEYSLPLYGERRPILIDLVLKADRNIENKYSFIRKEKDLLVAETDAPCVKGESRLLWGKAAPIRSTNDEIVGAIETIRDTTERKQMEDALRKSETKYRELVQNANSIIYRRDTEGNITFFNEYAQGFFGFSEDEILGKNVVGTIVPEVDSTGRDLKAMVADISADTDRYAVNENENMRSNGERVWVAWTNKALRDEDGTTREILCVGNNMTERRMIQEKLRESENWYRTLFETTGAGTVIIEEDTTLSLVNKEFEAITGYRKEELIGESWTKLISGDDLMRMKKYHDMRRQYPEAAPHNYEFTFVDKNGDKKEIVVNVSMIPGTKKSIASFLDITEQRRLAGELEESMKKYRLLADNVSDIIWIMDTDLRFTYISPSVSRLRGFSVEESLNQTLAETLTPASLEIAMKAFAEQREIETREEKDPTRSRKLELELTCKDGSTVWCEANMTGLRNSDGQVYAILGVTRNITDRVRAREALEIKSRSLEESNTALRVLLNQMDQNRQELQRDVLDNVNRLILPYIEKLKVHRKDNDRDALLQVIETNLNNIVSPFLRELTLTHNNLTPKEIEVATLVKEGKTNKEIADLLNVSVRSVEFHRDNIREKLGLKNKKANLRSSLLSLK